MRQPFLKHVSNDEFVAAYLGYDNTSDLNKLRFSPNTWRYLSSYATYKNPSAQYLAVKLIFEIPTAPRFPDQVEAFKDVVRSEELPGDMREFMVRLWKLAIVFDMEVRGSPPNGSRYRAYQYLGVMQRSFHDYLK
jgi:hypothetical protein